MSQTGKLGILVGGGPAPGINSVIGAATIRAELSNVEVLGIRNGYENLIAQNLDQARPLTIQDVSRIHFRGGSVLGISRANPTESTAAMDKVADSIEKLGISMLISIGGDDTAYSAMKLKKRCGDKLRVVHVPKTIDNDLDLPPAIDTFGYQTARHVGCQIVQDIMTDARTTSRWYFLIAMGRKAGHLALGMGKAAGATLTLIPEEFPDKTVQLSEIVDTLALAIVKRHADGRSDGVAVIAEGVMLKLDGNNIPESVRRELDSAERDAHGHLRLGDVNTGDILRKAVAARLTELGAPKTTIVAKDIGYELRCADPIPFDTEYTRDLGYAAAKYILQGGDGVMVSMQGADFVPIPFEEMLDPTTGKTKVRMVDVHSPRYSIARRYMIRLRRDDFEQPPVIDKIARVIAMAPETFVERFRYLVRYEAPALTLRDPQ